MILGTINQIQFVRTNSIYFRGRIQLRITCFYDIKKTETSSLRFVYLDMNRIRYSVAEYFPIKFCVIVFKSHPECFTAITCGYKRVLLS